jgi:hypothetical protein
MVGCSSHVLAKRCTIRAENPDCFDLENISAIERCILKRGISDRFKRKRIAHATNSSRTRPGETRLFFMNFLRPLELSVCRNLLVQKRLQALAGDLRYI